MRKTLAGPKGIIIAGRTSPYLEVDVQDNSVVVLYSGGSPNEENRTLRRWAKCEHTDCFARAVRSTCFWHSSPPDRATAIEESIEAGSFELYGASITSALWASVLDADRRVGGALISVLRLAGVTVLTPLSFADRTFVAPVDPAGSVFEAPLVFKRCEFRGAVVPRHIAAHSVEFSNCIFRAGFHASDVVGALDLHGSSFDESFALRGAQSAIADGCRFRGDVRVEHASVKMWNATFHADVNFSGTGGMNLVGSSFERTANIVSLPDGDVNLRKVVFESRTAIRSTGQHIHLEAAQFKQGGVVMLRGGTLFLKQCVSGGGLHVAGLPDAPVPKILSLQDAEVSRLSLARVDVTECSFEGAYGLSTLQIDSTVKFQTKFTLGGERRVLKDEPESYARDVHVTLFGVRLLTLASAVIKPAVYPEIASRVHPRQLAEMYRELRRSFEARSDMTGAADFYVGEMEMRRIGPTRSRIERLLLRSYRMLSGYGTRPDRALMSLVALVVVGAACFHQLEAASYSHSLFVIAHAVVPTFRQIEANHYATGWLLFVVRILGALLIALFFLAAKTMVMRKPSD